MNFGKKKAFLIIIVAFICAGVFLGINHSSGKIKISYDPNDGTSKISTKTIQSQKGKTLQKVLESNGYNIDKELYQYSVSLSTPSTKVKSLQIKKRANGVITIGKKKIKYSSAQKNISGLLKEKNITVNKDDIVSPGLSTALTAKVKKINIIQVIKTKIASTEEIPYQTEVVASDSVAQGDSKVEQSGSNGKKEVVSEAVYHNGVLVSSKTKSSTVTVQPTSMKVSMNPSDISSSTNAANSTDIQEDSNSSSSTSTNSGTTTDNSTNSNNSDIAKTSDKSGTSTTTNKNSNSDDSKSKGDTDTNNNNSSASNSSESNSASQSQNSNSSNDSTSGNQNTSTTDTKKTTDTNSNNNSSTSTTDEKTTTKTVTSTVAIPHQSYNIYVSNLEKGKTQITTQGVDGEKTVATEMTYKGDQLISQKVVSEAVTKQPVTEVIAVGTKEAASSTSQAAASDTSSQSSTNTSGTTSDSSNSTANSNSASSSSTTTGYAFSQYVSQTKNITYNNKTENLSSTDFDLLCAVVAQEDNSSYEGALAVVSCIMNRADSGKWGGSTAIAVIKAKGQFSAYLSGAYKKYLNGKTPSYVQAAVKDCVYGGVRNHKYLSFQAGKKKNSVKIGGNYYQ
jgi:uncharacterized protein YabE (DUF348 family)